MTKALHSCILTQGTQEATEQFVVNNGKHVLLDGASATLQLKSGFAVMAGSHLCVKDVILDGLKRSQGVLVFGVVRFEDVVFQNCVASVRFIAPV